MISGLGLMKKSGRRGLLLTRSTVCLKMILLIDAVHVIGRAAPGEQGLSGPKAPLH